MCRTVVAGIAAGCGLVLASCAGPLDREERRAYTSFRRDLVDTFRAQIAESAARPTPGIGDASVEPDTPPWWDDPASGTIAGGEAYPVPLLEVLERTLSSSSQIRVFSDIPLIRQTAIDEAEGRFVPRFFAEAKWDHADDAVGSTLQTGGSSRFIEDEIVGEAGVRTRLQTGADLSISQRVGHTDNNSVFFVPNPQARGALTVSLVQPLLKGAGVRYNRSIIQIAELDTQIGQEEMLRQVQVHLLEVTRAYWALQLTRAVYLQQQRLVDRTRRILDTLEGRSGLDASGEVLSRTRAALGERSSELVRTEMAVRNAEDRLRSLVNDAQLGGSIELIPSDPFTTTPLTVELTDAAEAALRYRPEIAQAFYQWRAALVRLGIAKNEDLPRLDFIIEGILDGLDGADPSSAFGDQFSEGGPAWLVGMRFETPLDGAEDRARLLRRRLELRQQSSQVQTTIETVLLEVKVAVREVTTAYRELGARASSLDAANEDLRVLQKRWDGGVETSGLGGVTFLELLLDGQNRLADAERAYVEAQAAYTIALANLQRVQGTLLSYSDVDAVLRRDEEGLDRIELSRFEGGVADTPVVETDTSVVIEEAPAGAPEPEEVKPAPAPRKPEPKPDDRPAVEEVPVDL